MYNRLVCALVPALRHPTKRYFTVTAKLHVKIPTIIDAPPPALQRLLDSEASAILYSSYVDDLTPSWRQTSQQERRKSREQSAQMHADAKVRPFSLALQHMQGDQQQPPPHGQPTVVECRPPVDAGDDDVNVMSPMLGTAASIDKRAWMHDYESYKQSNDAEEENSGSDDDGESAADVIYGTPDASVPVSKIPCHGCGAPLQCAEPSLPGYLPSEIFAGQNEEYLKTITCQRCHFLRHYNTVIDVTVPAAEYVRLISSIQDRFALAILLVDLTDLPSSIWPNIADIIGPRRPVIVVGNKVDLLPRDTDGHLTHVRAALERAVASQGIDATNIKHTCLISAHTGFGVEELITKLHNVWSYRGDVYLLGCTNVGKSTLFNALLRSDYCKSQASSLIGRATASPWPGTTMRMLKFPIMRPNDWRLFLRTKRIVSQRGQRAAELRLRRDQAQQQRHRSEHATLIGHIDQTFRSEQLVEVNDAFGMGTSKRGLAETLNERGKQFVTSKWCFDTPGVVQPEQTLNLLTTVELLLAIPRRMLVPRTFRLQPGWTLFVSGLGRVDLVSGGSAEQTTEAVATLVTVYASDRLPVLIVRTVDAERVYSRFLGTDVLAVPHTDDEADTAGRLARWPALVGQTIDVLGEVDGSDKSGAAVCDIVLSSAGWVGVHAKRGERLQFEVWTPQGRGIVQRAPALIPFGRRLSGPRVRGSLAHQNRRAFV